MTSTIRLLSIGLIITAFACDFNDSNEGPTQEYQSASDQLIAEFNGEEIEQAAIDKVIALSKVLTEQYRVAGANALKAALETKLQAAGKTSTTLNQVGDHAFGEALPGLDWELADEVESDIGGTESRLSEENPNAEHFPCPPIGETGRDSCVMLVDAAKQVAKDNIEPEEIENSIEQMVDQDELLKEQSAEFRDYAKTYLGDLALAIHKFGIEVATVRAEYTLRDEGVCDDEKIDGEEIARLRGIEESTDVLRELVYGGLEIRPEGAECLAVGKPGKDADDRIDRAITKWIDKYKTDGEICKDMGLDNENVKKAYEKYEEGLRRGIESQLTTVWIGIFRNGKPWKIDQKILVANIDGCEAKDQITYTTSPLVVDLDNDGLQLTTDRVRFDLRATGQPQQCTWAGKREGFLVLDKNSDGRISSGRELFGNRTLCGADRCADGAAALAQHDSNHDGRIDRRDPVFAKLQIWIDANQDGRSEASELQSLTDHGIKSFSLKASYASRKVAAGTISLTLGVETDQGTRTAYDVWFDNQTAPGFQAFSL